METFPRKKYYFPVFLLLILSSFFLGGCSRWMRAEQPLVAHTVELHAGRTIGQTFVAKYDGLSGVFFYFSPAKDPGRGKLTLHLRTGPQASSDLAVSLNSIAIDQITTAGYYGFLLPAQIASNQKYYYAYVDITGDGRVEVGESSGSTYLEGALYQNGTPQDTQASFQLKYSRKYALLGLGIEVLNWIGYLALGLFLFVLPGWGLLSLLWPGWPTLSWTIKVALSASLSLAVYPLLLLWTDLVHLHLGVLYAWLPPLGGLAIILWRNRKKLTSPIKVHELFPHLKKAALLSTLPDLLFVVVVAVIVFIRFWMIRSIDVPLWADSVQHTAIAQLIVDNGGLFQSWLPYAPYRTLTVQFGFPVFAALLSWLAGFSSAKAVLVVGQMINSLAVIAVFPLAVRMARGNRWAGVGAVLIAGLVLPMPAYFVNWGRYAQLAGQAILPVSCWLGWELVSPTERGRSRQKQRFLSRAVIIGLLAVILAGMALSYYRMVFYFGLFIVVVLIAIGIPEWRLEWRTWAAVLGALSTLMVLTLILFLPWAMRLPGSILSEDIQAGISNAGTFDAVKSEILSWKNFFASYPLFLVIVTGISLLWSLFRKRWMVAGQALWIVLLVTFMAAQLIRFPGSNMMDSFTIMITCYIPISLTVGWMISEIANIRIGIVWHGGLAATLLALAAYGAIVVQRPIVQPDVYTFVTRPDVNAMAWVQQNISTDSVFFVEGIMYRWHSILGGDAGWWIPLLSGRKNTIPPQYALLNEEPIQPGYTQQMISLVEDLQTTPLNSPKGFSLLCSEGVTHVFVGQMQGESALRMLRSPQLFPPAVLLNSSYYNLIYHQDRVYIFSLDRKQCP